MFTIKIVSTTITVTHQAQFEHLNYPSVLFYSLDELTLRGRSKESLSISPSLPRKKSSTKFLEQTVLRFSGESHQAAASSLRSSSLLLTCKDYRIITNDA